MFTFDYDNSYDPPIPVANVELRSDKDSSMGVHLTGILDSGSDVTLVPVRVLRRIGAQFVGERWFRGVIGNAQRAELYVIHLRVGNIDLPGIRAIARTEDAETILGRNVLNRLTVLLNGPAETTEIADSASGT